VKTPSRDTLSPGERDVHSLREGWAQARVLALWIVALFEFGFSSFGFRFSNFEFPFSIFQFPEEK
jgi:hypothetical protein